MNTFIALKFLTQLLSPPGLLLGGVVGGVLLRAMRLPRLGWLVAAAGVAQAIIFSFNPVADALLLPLEDQARAAAAAARACCYEFIVVLGAGVLPAAPPLRPDPELTEGSDRLWYAARLYRRGIAPQIIVSGGSLSGQPEAAAMKQVLLDLGIPADRIVLEDRSLNTIDNVREVRALVGADRVALVTSGYHMPRALQRARQARLNAEAFPTDWRVVSSDRPEWDRFLPSVEAIRNSTLALKEYVALAFDYRGPN